MTEVYSKSKKGKARNLKLRQRTKYPESRKLTDESWKWVGTNVCSNWGNRLERGRECVVRDKEV